MMESDLMMLIRPTSVGGSPEAESTSLSSSDAGLLQRKVWRSKSVTSRSDESSIVAVVNPPVTPEELKELKQWYQWDKSISIHEAIQQERSVWQRQHQAVRSNTAAENEKLKRRMQQLHLDNYELTRMLQNQRILFRDEEAAARRAERLAATKARLESRAEQRLKVMEAAAVQEAHLQIKQLQEVVEDKDRTIAKLEAEKFYLGERVFQLTGVEESFWNDEKLPKPVITERERGLLHRASSLHIHLTQLQRQQRLLSNENEQLKRQMEMEQERERPVASQRERERQQELQLLRKKNHELALQTKKLEEKVRSLEKKSKELPVTPTAHQLLPGSRSVPLQQQQQHNNNNNNVKEHTVATPWRWREKEVEMQGLTARLSEREREIGRLKEKLRELTKKLQQEQQYNSKESLQHQQSGTEWTVLSQGSRELEGLLKLVSKERLQLERHFVLATQGLQRSAELDVTRYSALEATNVQLRRQVEQLELLCKEQAEAAQQLSKRQQDREVLAERLKAKQEYSQDLENQLGKVIDKNAELTIENCDLKEQVQELRQFEAECRTLRSSLSTVESQCQEAQSEVAQLKEKMAGLDHVLRQMREAAEKKKELEKQHGEALNELRTAQATLGLLAGQHRPNTESERAQHAQNIESLQSRIRELERKMELQNVRHDELLLELAALRKNTGGGGGGGGSGGPPALGSSQSFDLDSRGSTPESMTRYMSNGGSRTTPLGQSASNLDALLEMDLAVANYSLGKSHSQPAVSSLSGSHHHGHGHGHSHGHSHLGTSLGTTAGGSSGSSGKVTATSSDIERIMAKIEQDNRVLAELDKSRATILAQDKGKTVTFAADDLVLHYGGGHGGYGGLHGRHRRIKSSPAHHHHQQQLQQQHHHLLYQQQLSRSQPVFSRHPHQQHHRSGTYRKNSSYTSHHNGPGGVASAMGASGIGSTMIPPPPSSSAGGGGTSVVTSSSSALYGPLASSSSSAALAADLSRLTAPSMSSSGSLLGHGLPTVSPLSLPALPLDALNSIVPLHSFRNPEPESSADMLEIPGKGRCYVYLAKYTYDPFTQSPNENPEAELPLTAGDYILVWGNMDEDGFYEGELLDGRKGLVPSNFIQRLQGEDLVEFHRAAVLGLQVCGDDSSTTSLPRDLLGISPAGHGRSVHQQSHPHQSHHPHHHHSAAEPVDQVNYITPGSTQVAFHSPAARRAGAHQYDAARQALDWGLMELQEFLEDEELDKGEGPVPPPRQLTLERQLNKSVIIGWNHPEGSPPESGHIACYHVYVDGILRTTVRAGDRCRALIEGVDSNRPHRISVRSVTQRRRASLDAACTMVIGKDVPSAPTCVRVSHVTATSALISWLPANSNYQHAVCVNHVEVRTVKPSVFRHTISGLSPNTVYRVTVKAKNIRAPHFQTPVTTLPTQVDESTRSYNEKFSTHVEFRTLPKGVPDPPVDVQVELGPQEGSLLVTWLPVTINSQSGKSNGVPVTGYVVYADGRKITEIDSPTGDHAVLDLTTVVGLQARHVTVRTKARESLSGDSIPSPVPLDLIRSRGMVNRKDDEASPDDSDGKLNDPTVETLVAPPSTSSHASSNAAPILPQVGMSSEDAIGLWNLSLLASIKETLESDERPSELSDIAEEPEEDQDCSESSDGEMMNEGNPRGRRMLDPAGRGMQRNQYGNHVPGPIPSIEITKDTGSVEGYRTGGRQMGNRNAPLGRNAQQTRPGDNYYGGRPGDPYNDQQTGGRRGAGGGRPGAGGGQQTRIFVALFDYDPPTMSPNPDACEEELPFREGQLIKVRGDKDADGFYWGEVGGRSGYVPCNMVSEVQVDDERVAQELLKESGADGPSHSRTRRNLRAQGQPGQGRDRWGDIYANMPVKRMIALYDYDPQELSPNVDAEVELSFQTGDIIYVYGDMDDDGFYLGELRGQRGLVPSNFLTDAPPDYDPSQPGRGGQKGRPNLGPHDKPGPQDRGRDPYYGNRNRDRMDHDRMMDTRGDPRGMSGAEGPPPPPRTTGHGPRGQSDSRDRRSDIYDSPDRHEVRPTAAAAAGGVRDGNQRYYGDDSFSDVDDRFRGGPNAYPGTDVNNYGYNNSSNNYPGNYNNGGTAHHPDQHHHQPMAQQQQMMNGPSIPHHQQQQQQHPPGRMNPRGLMPAVLPDPGVQPGQHNMSNYHNAPQMTGQQQQQQSSGIHHPFSFFGGHQQQQQQQQQQQHPNTGPSLIQKMMGAASGHPNPTTMTTAPTGPTEGLLSKGKDLLFKKFGL